MANTYAFAMVMKNINKSIFCVYQLANVNVYEPKINKNKMLHIHTNESK